HRSVAGHDDDLDARTALLERGHELDAGRAPGQAHVDDGHVDGRALEELEGGLPVTREEDFEIDAFEELCDVGGEIGVVVDDQCFVHGEGCSVQRRTRLTRESGPKGLARTPRTPERWAAFRRSSVA